MAPPLSLKARALRWLSQREHSRLELRRKLLRAARPTGTEPADAPAAQDRSAEIEALLDWLAAQRYLSEERFVESRVNARARRFGNRRIAHELAQHGAALDAATAEQLAASELQRALAVWQRKYGSSPAADAPARARQMRFLASRGFSAEVIRRVVRPGGPDVD
jgi:regulatory protein